jgi:hypothetical protein
MQVPTNLPPRTNTHVTGERKPNRETRFLKAKSNITIESNPGTAQTRPGQQWFAVYRITLNRIPSFVFVSTYPRRVHDVRYNTIMTIPQNRNSRRMRMKVEKDNPPSAEAGMVLSI